MRLDWKKNNPVNMVGDGKSPNIYWVTATTDFAFLTPAKKKGDGATIEYAEKLMKSAGIKSYEHKDRRAVFSTFKEAYEYAEEMSAEMPEEPVKDGIHRITIEDRQDGTLWEKEIIAYPIKKQWVQGWKFEAEVNGPSPEDYEEDEANEE